MNFLRPREEARLLAVPKPPLDDLAIRLPLMTGVSPSEVADLNIDDVYYEYNVLFVYRSKTSIDHPVLVDAETMFRIFKYLDKRQRGSLLLLEGERRMKAQHLRRIVKRWAREAELSRWYRVTPYTLRHTFCVKWVMAGGSLEGLRRQLGHKSLQKLQHYLDFDYSHVVAEYNRIFASFQRGATTWAPEILDVAEKLREAETE